MITNFLPTKKEIERRKKAKITEISENCTCEICGKEDKNVFQNLALVYFCNVCAWTNPAYMITNFTDLKNEVINN